VLIPRYDSRKNRCYSRLTVVTRLFVLGCVSALALGAASNAAAQDFISYSSNPRNVLEGNWQSCQDERGRYAERVYDHVVNGQGQFEVHLGPRREFAIFRGVQDDHREHNAPENLLKPFMVPMQGSRAQRRWEIPELKLAFTVTLGGGSRLDCESWYILLEPFEKTSQ
jgi:hypothetical protein